MMKGKINKTEIAWFVLRHPFKAVGLGIATVIGVSMSSNVDWYVCMIQVQSGDSSINHQLAEGIER